jgi:transcriptional regulator with XRE-family HTH domain
MLEVTIREACEKHHKHQTEIADETGISKTTMSKYWRGNRVRRVDLAVVEKVAKALGVPALSLFKETPDTN